MSGPDPERAPGPDHPSPSAPGRKIELAVEVPGTPEEVWRAIATGPGITSWFVPTRVEEHEGGAVEQDFGEMGTDTGRVAAWQPPERVVFVGGSSNGAPLAFEWLVEAAGGDTCIVRLVNTGFGDGEEWDGDYDGMSMGWRLFLENLRLHLAHFRGREATAAVPMAMVPGPNAEAWTGLCRRVGADPGARDGDTIELHPDPAAGGEPWRGRVERTLELHALRASLLVLERPAATGFLAAEGEGDHVAVSAYLYFYGDGAEEDAATWRAAWARQAAPPH